MLWLFQVWGMDGQLLRCAVQRLPSCLPLAQSTAVVAEKIQHLSSHSPSIAFNLLVTVNLLISVRVCLLRWQTTSWLILKLLCHLLMVVKCGSGNLQQLEVSFFPNNVHVNKTRALIYLFVYCPGCAITAHSVVFKSFSGLENTGNSCPVTKKICHNPEHVSSGVMILGTTLGI